MSEHLEEPTSVELLHLFAAFLREEGYPEASLIFEAPLGGLERRAIDLLVVRPETGEPLAIVEAKRSLGSGDRKFQAIDQLRRYKVSADVPFAYLVATAAADSDVPFSIHLLDDNDLLIAIAPDDFPSYAGLVAIVVAIRNRMVRQKTKEATDNLHTACWILAGILLLAIVIDPFRDLITPVRLSAYLLVSALTVLPYATRIKVLGLEWERYRKP